jgi:hypothetical protein
MRFDDVLNSLEIRITALLRRIEAAPKIFATAGLGLELDLWP